VDYVRSYSRFYSRAESKTLQRAREQLFQEREMGALVRRLKDLHGPLRGARVLEIGSGSGGRAVAVALEGAEVLGIEPGEAGVVASRVRARRYPDLKADFRVGVGERLPFPDESFDLVFSTEVLQHVQDLERTISETYRVLRRGGHCYHEAPNNLYPWEFHYRVFWIPYLPRPLGRWYARMLRKDPRHLDDIRFLYRPSLSALLRRHGFGQVRDLYGEEFRQKALQTDSIRSPAKRRALHLLRRLGLAGLALAAISTLGIHPQLRICASKAQGTGHKAQGDEDQGAGHRAGAQE
jgi:SAM-dependent methyltransferase